MRRPEVIRTAAMWAWILCLLGALWALHRLGGVSPAPPPWRWGPWLSTADTATAVVAILRTLAIVAAWYLALLTLAGTVARRAQRPALVEVTDAATPAFVRALLTSAGGLTLSAAGLSLGVAPLLAPGETPGIDLVAAAATPAAPVPSSALAERASLERVPVGDGADPTAVLRPFQFRLAPLQAPLAATAADGDIGPRDSDESGEPAIWVAETGDHLWTIAAETLAESWGRPGSEAEVAAYWATVVAANGSNLVVPGDADLIFPGQVFDLPPVPQLGGVVDQTPGA